MPHIASPRPTYVLYTCGQSIPFLKFVFPLLTVKTQVISCLFGSANCVGIPTRVGLVARNLGGYLAAHRSSPQHHRNGKGQGQTILGVGDSCIGSQPLPHLRKAPPRMLETAQFKLNFMRLRSPDLIASPSAATLSTHDQNPEPGTR